MPCIIRGREVTNRRKIYCAPYCPFYAKNQAPSEARGVVIGGPKHAKSCEEALIDSKMAGPIAMKLSGIDQGNSVTVLGPRD